MMLVRKETSIDIILSKSRAWQEKVKTGFGCTRHLGMDDRTMIYFICEKTAAGRLRQERIIMTGKLPGILLLSKVVPAYLMPLPSKERELVLYNEYVQPTILNFVLIMPAKLSLII